MITLANLNKMARDSGFSLLAAVAAQRVLEHVKKGGWLGANADHYAMGIKSADDKIAVSGFSCFTDDQRREGFILAELVNPALWNEAAENFRLDSEGEHGEFLPARIRGNGEADIPHDGEVWVASGQSLENAAAAFEADGHGIFYCWL
jgi:hypothetical protein